MVGLKLVTGMAKGIAVFHQPKVVVEHTVTDEVELKREFERVHACGYSTDQEESVLEGCCFGTPILDARVMIAISSALLTSMKSV